MTPQHRVVWQARKATVLLVDDHPIVRQGLTQLINQEPDLAVCGHAEDAASAFHAIAVHRPDIVVLDISLNGPDGLTVLKEMRMNDPVLPVLVLSMHDESLYAERALRAGANGYIMKQEATERVLEAIRRIRGGEVYVSDRIAKRLLRQVVSSPSAAGKSPMEALSDRELTVFRLIGEGRGTREIADDLHVSVKTVESYQAHIKEKLSLSNGRELVQHAIRWVTREDGV
ncbi:MAG: response regulator transcription factor [Candidatus Sulfopaludibacter sp.]|nr:response regulator transcription factor [Candidatus Sulfopaludibacter sp.]